MDAWLTYAVLILMAYAGLRKLGILSFNVKDLLTAIPLTPPQAEARYQAKIQAQQLRRDYVIGRPPRSMLRNRRSGTTRTTGTGTAEPAPIPVMSSAAPRYEPLSEIQQERVRELLTLGWSQNKIYSLLGGNREKRMAEIKAVRADVDAESLARMIAKADIQVPEYVDPQTALQQDAA